MSKREMNTRDGSQTQTRDKGRATYLRSSSRLQEPRRFDPRWEEQPILDLTLNLCAVFEAFLQGYLGKAWRHVTSMETLT